MLSVPIYWHNFCMANWCCTGCEVLYWPNGFLHGKWHHTQLLHTYRHTLGAYMQDDVTTVVVCCITTYPSKDKAVKSHTSCPQIHSLSLERIGGCCKQCSASIPSLVLVSPLTESLRCHKSWCTCPSGNIGITLLDMFWHTKISNLKEHKLLKLMLIVCTQLTLILLESSSSKFCGFMSLWMTCCECTASTEKEDHAQHQIWTSAYKIPIPELNQ